jgi:hypothetical protein
MTQRAMTAIFNLWFKERFIFNGEDLNKGGHWQKGNFV